MAEIQKVSPKHEAIMNFIMANPTLPRSQVAAHFGVTLPWLSTIIHSGTFRARLAEKQDQFFECSVVSEIEDKVMGVAHLAVEKMAEAIPYENDLGVLTNTLDKTMKTLGYGQKTIGTQVNIHQDNSQNVNNISGDDIARARDLIGKARQRAAGDIPLELPGNDVQEDTPHLESGVGTPDPQPALPAPDAEQAKQVLEGD